MKAKKSDNITSAWITWEIQVRNRSMAKALDVPLHEFTSNRPRLMKYPPLIAKTFAVIYKDQPKFLFVQNPSIVLSAIAVFLKPIFKYKLIVDAHNSGIFPLEGTNRLLNLLAKFIARYSTYTIVTNSHLANLVLSWGGAPLIAPDPIPSLVPNTSKKGLPLRPYILFICTWANDEPFHEVIKAAAQVSYEVDIYITGNYRKRLKDHEIEQLPPNIRLLGFVPEHEYIDIFSGALAAIDLTTRDNCLVCGAYEAMALLVPCVVSDSPVNREIFKMGYVYVQNSAPEIAKGIQTVLVNHEELKADIAKHCAAHINNTERSIDSIKKATGMGDAHE